MPQKEVKGRVINDNEGAHDAVCFKFGELTTAAVLFFIFIFYSSATFWIFQSQSYTELRLEEFVFRHIPHLCQGFRPKQRKEGWMTTTIPSSSWLWSW